MSLFKVCRGAETRLPSTKTDGYAYFCTDTGSFYIDHKDASNTLVRSKISAQFADKLRYVKDGETIEIDASEVLTASNVIATVGVATTEQNGFMSSTDKTKLDGIEVGANNTIVDEAMSSTSTNPVQNKIIQEALDAKLDQSNPSATGTLSLNRKDGTTTGVYSDALGKNGTASGEASFAEGYQTVSSGYSTHAEGYETTASGHSAHAEGRKTVASGNYSHAEGLYTKASGNHQHVQGKYNVEDTENKYVHIVGNGGDETDRSNAHTIDWNGNAWFEGNLKVGGTSYTDSNAKKVATTDVATTSANGLMSSTDKSKLDGIAAGANAYTHPTHTAKASGLYKITVDGNGHVSGATAVAKEDITALGIPEKNTTYDVVTTAKAGLMSSTMLSKLNGIATGANKYTHPDTHPASMITDLATVATSGSYDDLSNKPSEATTSSAGLMSAADKTKLDGLGGSSEITSDDLPVVPIAKGGTGATTAKAAEYNLHNGIGESTNAIADSNKIIIMHGAPSATSGAFVYKQASLLKTYINAMPKSGGTFTGAVTAANDTAYTTYKVRNAAIVSATPSSMTNGTIAFVYS